MRPARSLAADQPQDDPFSLSGLGNQLMRLGSQLQSATSAARPAGLELTSFSTGTSSSGAMQPVLGAGAAGKAASASAAAAKPAPASGMLEEDPDLEAYLQVRCIAMDSCAGLKAPPPPTHTHQHILCWSGSLLLIMPAMRKRRLPLTLRSRAARRGRRGVGTTWQWMVRRKI